MTSVYDCDAISSICDITDFREVPKMKEISNTESIWFFQ